MSLDFPEGASYSDINVAMNRILREKGEIAGIPMPLPGLGLVLEDRHPWAARLPELQAIINSDTRVKADPPESPDEIVNSWYSHARRGRVYILRHKQTGKVSWFVDSDWPQRNRLIFGPCETATAWPLEAELKAVDRLESLITPHLFRMYICAGMFSETSKRSELTYVFRRLRPTIVISGHGSDYFHTGEPDVRILCTICLHPIAFYQNSHCGAMVPTDDVIAHLLMMRADESLFWRRGNQHAADSVLSGL